MSRRVLVAAAVLVAGGLLLTRLWGPITQLTASLAVLRAWVAGLGAFGPVGLIGLQVAQILVAPIPGYPVAVVAGLLFGTFWGGLYSTIGMMLGAALAAGLTRRFGRPLVERLVARGDMRRWEHLVLNDSPWFWFLVVLLPTGEVPYFLAGLSRVSIATFLVGLLAARGPAMFVIAFFAERALEVPTRVLVAASAALLLAAGIVFWRREQLAAWTERRLARASQVRRTSEVRRT